MDKLVRAIGRGAFGEIWLARSVTGKYFALKIVRRSNFDDDGPYQREFQGIQQYENISRGHAGLVDLLHVGGTAPRGRTIEGLACGLGVTGRISFQTRFKSVTVL